MVVQNITSFFTKVRNSNNQKSNTQKRDLTSFTGVAMKPSLHQDTVSFKGRVKAIPIGRESRAVAWNSGGPTRYEDFTICKHEYEPYSWEKPTLETKRLSDLNLHSTDIPDNYFEEYQPNCGSVGKRMTRQESLEHKMEKMIKFAEMKRAKATEHATTVADYKTLYDNAHAAYNKNDTIDDLAEGISSFFGRGSSKAEKNSDAWDRYDAKDRELTPEVNNLRSEANKMIDDHNWMMGEYNDIVSSKRKGELIDISAQNDSQANAPLESFLRDSKRTSNASWSDYKKVSLPDRTTRVTDVILEAHKYTGDAIKAITHPMQKSLVSIFMQQSDFVETVMKHVENITKSFRL